MNTVLSIPYSHTKQKTLQHFFFFWRNKHLWSSSLVSCVLLRESQQFKCGLPFSPLCWDLCSKEFVRNSRHDHQHSGCGLWQNRKRQRELRKLRGPSPREWPWKHHRATPVPAQVSYFFTYTSDGFLEASSLFVNSTWRDKRLFTRTVYIFMFDYMWNVRHVHVFGYVDSGSSHPAWKCMLCTLDSCAGCLFVCPDLLPILLLRALALGSRLCGYFRGRLLPPNFWLEWIIGRCQFRSEVGGERDGLFILLAAWLLGQEVQWLEPSRKGLCFCQTAPSRATVTEHYTNASGFL